MTKHSDQEIHAALFAHLVMSLTQSAMLALGKIVNPATGKAETNIEVAQQMIDLIDMLEAKTAGNLDEDEQRMIKSTLSMLKLNYVETAKSAPAASTAPAETPTPENESTAGEKKDDDGKVKYRKSYG